MNYSPRHNCWDTSVSSLPNVAVKDLVTELRETTLGAAGNAREGNRGRSHEVSQLIMSETVDKLLKESS